MKALLSGAGSRAVLAFLWLFQWLPLAWQAACGRALGAALWRLAASRRRVALRNLELCLPERPPSERERIARELFQWFSRSVLERGLLWYAPVARLRHLIHVEGDVGFADRHPGPVMWLVPHFVGLDVAGAAVQLYVRRPGVSIYQAQTNPVIDAAVRRGRLRHGNAQIFARSETAKPLMRAVRQGAGFFNLPDMDFGERDAAFVPFFGVPAATLLAPSRMARALGMKVQPVVAEMLPGGQGWRVRFLPPWDDFPTGDALADTARMNRWIEGQVRQRPEQYFWVHKRFKTRPAGEPGVY
ncbi:LpxL/LpxP family acyltransferase [Ramlibacter tataouinensis]|uniref:Acyltransferases-like protein n=1 Tax=Ramlibacter tataouinensis (strain ATCC BAA-407 / DSM 14655 / LMG 21543 / TTB310) TaxID=365046 RepID=F5XY74_RAMTT|nr:lipid A biosynthesis acyltransferase [Ramlibacter tataouinensis]AEG91867.1 Acyltransferases-like protein [Ramlibacter tataouinensis TTB310]